MGGSFTIYFEGNLYRVAGRDADALGKEPASAPELRPGATDEEFEALVWDQMRTVYDPEIPINIVELGLIYECRIKISLLPTVTAVNVELVFDPPWNQSMMSEAARLEAGLL
jgi:metal-sulfur cluster biosynthetic enzyme